MKFIWKALVAGVFIVTLQAPILANAAPTQAEVQTYLQEIGWTEKELKAYLDFYEVSLDDFKDIDALKAELGTPITKENLHKLIASYNITEEELEILLARFGEKVQDYTFIEDLDVAIDFYLTHEEEVARAENFFVSMGIKEREAHLLFQHLLRLDKDQLLPALAKIQNNLQTVSAKEEAIQVWQQFFEAFQLQTQLYQIKDEGRQTATSQQLIQTGPINNETWVLEISSGLSGEVLASLTLSDDMFTSAFVTEKGEELIYVANVVMDFSDQLYGTRMPQTATSYGAGMLIGLSLMFVGFFIRRRGSE